jgi:hypothetical protein
MIEVLLYLALTSLMTISIAHYYLDHQKKAKQTQFIQQMSEISRISKHLIYGRANDDNFELFNEKIEENGASLDDPWEGRINVIVGSKCIIAEARNLDKADCAYTATQIKSDCIGILADGTKWKYKTQVGGADQTTPSDELFVGQCEDGKENHLRVYYNKK